MDREMAQAWVEALESGKFKKGKYALCTHEEFCCLGVLAEVNGHLGPEDFKDFNGVRWFDDGETNVDELGRYEGTPVPATGWLPDGYMGLDYHTDQSELGLINDGSKDFGPVIAEIKRRWLS